MKRSFDAGALVCPDYHICFCCSLKKCRFHLGVFGPLIEENVGVIGIRISWKGCSKSGTVRTCPGGGVMNAVHITTPKLERHSLQKKPDPTESHHTPRPLLYRSLPNLFTLDDETVSNLTGGLLVLLNSVCIHEMININICASYGPSYFSIRCLLSIASQVAYIDKDNHCEESPSPTPASISTLDYVKTHIVPSTRSRC